MDSKKWAIFILMVAAIIGGMIWMSSQNRLNVSDINQETASKFIGADGRNGQIEDHTLGNPSAKVVMIEYGDYQCPGCSTTAPEAKKVAEEYKDHMLLIFRNYPISSIHPNARAAAAVAEAAGKQGKFWQMHDLLYKNQKQWASASPKDRTPLFASYAQELGLDQDKFSKDIASPEVLKKIDFDLAVGGIHNVTATPTFVINGKIVSLKDKGDIKDSVKSALNEAGVKVD
ncbi:hypothetical protein CR969_00145 [Candidatus Saccharibacteria bacterium]|nr:MAG: hypothetical protein CR969_00145 [Candidatus Saccharibacteria bacterium]